MSGCELGPRNGGALVFFGFFPPVCFLRRASAAAALSARICARCSSVKLGLYAGTGAIELLPGAVAN